MSSESSDTAVDTTGDTFTFDGNTGFRGGRHRFGGNNGDVGTQGDDSEGSGSPTDGTLPSLTADDIIPTLTSTPPTETLLPSPALQSPSINAQILPSDSESPASSTLPFLSTDALTGPSLTPTDQQAAPTAVAGSPAISAAESRSAPMPMPYLGFIVAGTLVGALLLALLAFYCRRRRRRRQSPAVLPVYSVNDPTPNPPGRVPSRLRQSFMDILPFKKSTEVLPVPAVAESKTQRLAHAPSRRRRSFMNIFSLTPAADKTTFGSDAENPPPNPPPKSAMEEKDSGVKSDAWSVHSDASSSDASELEEYYHLIVDGWGRVQRAKSTRSVKSVKSLVAPGTRSHRQRRDFLSVDVPQDVHWQEEAQPASATLPVSSHGQYVN